MVVELLFGRKKATQFQGLGGGLGLLTLDATLSEDGRFQNRITDFPIESGSFISDHILHDPETLTIEGFVTNTPVYILGNAGARIIHDEPYKEPVMDAYEFLLKAMGYSLPQNPTGRLGARLVEPLSDPILVDIVTEFRAYTDMAVESLSVPRRPDTGDALVFTATFKKVRQVEVKYTLESVSNKDGAPRANTQAAPNKDTGAAGTGEADNSLKSAAYLWLY